MRRAFALWFTGHTHLVTLKLGDIDTLRQRYPGPLTPVNHDWPMVQIRDESFNVLREALRRWAICPGAPIEVETVIEPENPFLVIAMKKLEEVVRS